MKYSQKKKNHKIINSYLTIKNTQEAKVSVDIYILINLKIKRNTYHNLRMNLMLLTKFFLGKDMLKMKKK
jgi:hypothetical protein